MLSDKSEPHVSFLAFTSDVDYEVQPVTSGHRVVLKYQLFLCPDDSDLAGPDASLLSGPPVALKESLQNLLDDPEFLPTGGLIGFGLQWTYSLDLPRNQHRTPVQDVITDLKGADLITDRLLDSLGLSAALMAIYGGDDDLALIASDQLIRPGLGADTHVEDSRGWFLYSDNGGVPIYDEYVSRLGRVKHAERENGVAVTWITHTTGRTVFKDSFIAYNDKASGQPVLDQLSADFGLMASVGPFGQRKGGPSVKETFQQYSL